MTPNNPIENSATVVVDSELPTPILSERDVDRGNSGSTGKLPVAAFVDNERENTRYEISNTIVCFPILPSHEIDVSYSVVGIAINIGVSGIKVRLETTESFEGLEVLIGVEQSSGEYHFCSGVVKSTCQTGEATVEAGIEFRGFMHEVLSGEHIFPVLDRTDMKFMLPYPESVLASLCKVGAAVSVPMDSVTLCPKCHSIPTFRHGCSLCLSSNVRASKMIHHFACANVDFVEKFELDNELCCQKCRMRRLIIGSDYEYLEGPNMCFDCGQANLEKIQIGHCLSCEYRFPSETAYSMEIVGYRVNRLDILGFVGTA